METKRRNNSQEKMAMLNVYVGYDSRESEAYAACVNSIRQNTNNQKVKILELNKRDLIEVGLYDREKIYPNEKASTEFAFTRFLVPRLNHYDGWAIFVDCDFIFTRDISELFALRDTRYAVQCVKHEYTPRFAEKMDGQKQVIYPRKNWSSLMMFNCASNECKQLSPDKVSRSPGSYLHQMNWAITEDKIGPLPLEWNWLEGEYKKPQNTPAAIHFTNGGPWFREIVSSRPIDFYREYLKYSPEHDHIKRDIFQIQSGLNK